MKSFHALTIAVMLAVAPASLLGISIPAMAANTADAVPAIISAGSRADAVRRLRDVPSVGVINLRLRPSILRDDDDGTDYFEIRSSVSKNAAGIRKLRAALAANPVTRNALESRGVAISRIVGVKIGSNGALRVYVL